ncbi:MAG TPA: universal stress protein, partial [Prosthecobacter sp.]|nr:universal stress protein [Prosthecobacter sp.]
MLKISVSGLLCLQHGTAGGMMAAETLTMTSTEALSAPRTAVTPAYLLVAVDFTRELGTVLRTAVALATRIGAKMTLLHVLEPITDDPEITLHWGNFPRERREHARQQLETLARESGAEAAELVLAEGRAFEEIVRNAQDRGCDLVVMGRTGEERGFIHEVLGSTVEKVARHARCPVFIVGEEQAPGPQEPRCILLPTDFSEDSRAAFAWAELIARQYDAKLLLANVQEPMGLPGTVEYRRFDDQIDALREEADERLETFRQEHLPVDLTVETHVVEGTPDRALCRLARREQVDLIVMSTHGAQGWRRAWLGGTAEGVLREVPCSVLVVPPTHRVEEPEDDSDAARRAPRQSAQEQLAGIDLSAPVASLMRADFPAVAHHATIGDALTHIRQVGVGERLIYFYVTGPEGRLMGVIPTRRLLTSPLEDKVEAHMIQNVTVLRPEESLLEASEVFAKRKFLALPVIDENGRLVGVVDVGLLSDKIFDLAEREQLEDLFETIGFNVAQVKEASPVRAFRFRFPWLLATITSGTLCAVLTSVFELTLEKSIVLAFFMTLILGLGESVSIQSMTVAIQALRSTKPTLRWYLGALRREALTALLLGAGCGLIVALIVWLWRSEVMVAASIGTSIALALVTACVTGLSVPALLHALRLDPKIA